MLNLGKLNTCLYWTKFKVQKVFALDRFHCDRIDHEIELALTHETSEYLHYSQQS